LLTILQEMNNKEITSKEPKEFYEHSDPNEVSMCNHFFIRAGSSRVMCKRCGLGFFDNPMDPFPIEEINKQIKNEVNNQKEYKNKNIVENN